MQNMLNDRKGLRFWIYSAAAVFAAIVLIGRAGGQAAGGAHVETRKATTRSAAVNPLDVAGSKDLLYVLDTNNREPESQVLLLDTNHAEILQRFKAWHMPDMALSADGASLYINSSQFDSTGGAWHHWLETFDTATANSLSRVPSPDTLIYTSRQYPTTLAVSKSGRRLFMLKNRQTIDNDDYYIATFDTAKGDFLPGHASLN